MCGQLLERKGFLLIGRLDDADAADEGFVVPIVPIGFEAACRKRPTIRSIVSPMPSKYGERRLDPDGAVHEDAAEARVLRTVDVRLSSALSRRVSITPVMRPIS
jgi:hypothetical protein